MRVHRPRDLQTVVRGQRVQRDGVRGRGSHQGIVHLIRREDALALALLPLIAHRHPHVGVHGAGTAHGLQRVLHHAHEAAVLTGDGIGGCHHLGVGQVAGRAPRHDLHAHLRTHHHEGVAAVVAVAHVGGTHTGRIAESLADRHDVGQPLAGVMGMGEGVDHRHVGVLGQFHHLAVVHGADDDGVDEARQHLGGVLDRLAAAQLHVAARQHDGGAAQPGDADLE